MDTFYKWSYILVQRSRWLKCLIIQIFVCVQEGGFCATRGGVEVHAKTPRSWQTYRGRATKRKKRFQKRSVVTIKTFVCSRFSTSGTFTDALQSDRNEVQTGEKRNRLSVCCARCSKHSLIALFYFCKGWFHWSWQPHVNGHVCRPASAKVLVALLYLPHFPRRTDTVMEANSWLLSPESFLPVNSQVLLFAVWSQQTSVTFNYGV